MEGKEFRTDNLFECGNEKILEARKARNSALEEMLKAMEAFVKAWKNEGDVLSGYFGYDIPERRIGECTFETAIEVMEHIIDSNR